MRTLLLVFLLQSAYTLTAESQKQAIFKKFFYSDEIESNLCAENVLNLLRLWNDSGVDLRAAEVWQIKNKGNSYFGLLKYYQNRFVGFQHFPYPENPDYHSNSGGGGWYYHVILVSDGIVYDTSYKPTPTMTPLRVYILDMFSLQIDIGEAFYERKQYGRKAIHNYFVTTYNAADYLTAKREKKSLSDYKKQDDMITNMVNLNDSQLGQEDNKNKTRVESI